MKLQSVPRPIALKLEQLPSPPSGLNMVLQACKDPNVSLHKLSRLVCAEPSLVVELLRVANSAWYGGTRTIRSGQQAVMLLGSRTVRNHAVAHVLRVVAADIQLGDFDGDLFWTHALRRATSALVLGREAGCEDPWEVFTAGLIQDSGTLLMAAVWPDAATGLAEVQCRPAPERLAAERELVGMTHAELFADVAERWGLPNEIVLAVAHHHQDTPVEGSRQTQRLCELTRVADLLADVFLCPQDTEVVGRATLALEALPTRATLELSALITQIEHEVPQIAERYRLPSGDTSSVATMVSEAVASIVQITHHYEHVTQELETLLEERQRLTRMLEVSNSRLQRMATTDELTGQANRRFFVENFNETAIACAERAKPVSVVMIDLDRFKQVNDTHGHATGDEVLRAVATCLARTIRPGDLLGRIGGEEFAILLPDTDKDTALHVAMRCQQQLADTSIATRGGVRLSITASFGGSTTQGRCDPEQLMNSADEQMYRAKQAGGNRVCWPPERRKQWT